MALVTHFLPRLSTDSFWATLLVYGAPAEEGADDDVLPGSASSGACQMLSLLPFSLPLPKFRAWPHAVLCWACGFLCSTLFVARVFCVAFHL